MGIVMPALVAGIHVLMPRQFEDVDGRNKSGQDEGANDQNTLQSPLSMARATCPASPCR